MTSGCLLSGEDLVPCRRMTVPLDGSSQQATIAPLMKDDSYTFCELPRVNPNNKVPPSSHLTSEAGKVCDRACCDQQH